MQLAFIHRHQRRRVNACPPFLKRALNGAGDLRVIATEQLDLRPAQRLLHGDAVADLTDIFEEGLQGFAGFYQQRQHVRGVKQRRVVAAKFFLIHQQLGQLTK